MKLVKTSKLSKLCVNSLFATEQNGYHIIGKCMSCLPTEVERTIAQLLFVIGSIFRNRGEKTVSVTKNAASLRSIEVVCRKGYCFVSCISVWLIILFP